MGIFSLDNEHSRVRPALETTRNQMTRVQLSLSGPVCSKFIILSRSVVQLAKIEQSGGTLHWTGREPNCEMNRLWWLVAVCAGRKLEVLTTLR